MGTPGYLAPEQLIEQVSEGLANCYLATASSQLELEQVAAAEGRQGRNETIEPSPGGGRRIAATNRRQPDTLRVELPIIDNLLS